MIAPGRHAAIIMDRAGWHTTHALLTFSNITLIFLPPYSPELNPMEQVWLQLRQNSLANRCFEDYEDIVESCCAAWNTFSRNYDEIKSLCQRDWINL
jgi:transposase